MIYRGNDDLLLGAKTVATAARKNPVGIGADITLGGGDRGGRVGNLRPASPLSSGSSASTASRTGAVSTTDMNESLSLDMGSYFFPTSRSVHLDCFTPRGTRPPPPFRAQKTASSNRRHNDHEGAMIHRDFDGGSLMVAACPLPAAKFVDLRSSISVDRSSSLLSVGAVATGDWASLVGHLAKVAPVCPRKGLARADDVCIAAHHVVRGAASGTDAAHFSGSRTPGVKSIRRGEGDNKEARGSAAAMAASAMAETSSTVGEALRKYHECPEWRTVTDVSSSPGERRQLTRDWS